MVEMEKRKNKKAWLRILESVIGVLIILLALIFFVSQQTKNIGKSEKAEEVLGAILDSIEKNQTLREAVINEDNTTLQNFIASQINTLYPFYNFTFCMTQPHLTCSQQNFYPYQLPKKKEIFSDSILISYEENNRVKSTKFMLYIWQK